LASNITVRPITEGNETAWRAFVAELEGARRVEWAESQRRCGISRQVLGMTSGSPSLSITVMEAADPEAARRRLAESSESFDVWYRRTLDELLGETLDTEVVFDSARRRGPWRGWRIRKWPA
jgi:hypothetical protein